MNATGARYNIRMYRICVFPKVRSGGMASFRAKFEAGLSGRGIQITNDPGSESDAILVIGGNRHLLPVWKAKRRGIPIGELSVDALHGAGKHFLVERRSLEQGFRRRPPLLWRAGLEFAEQSLTISSLHLSYT